MEWLGLVCGGSGFFSDFSTPSDEAVRNGTAHGPHLLDAGIMVSRVRTDIAAEGMRVRTMSARSRLPHRRPCEEQMATRSNDALACCVGSAFFMQKPLVCSGSAASPRAPWKWLPSVCSGALALPSRRLSLEQGIRAQLSSGNTGSGFSLTICLAAGAAEPLGDIPLWAADPDLDGNAGNFGRSLDGSATAPEEWPFGSDGGKDTRGFSTDRPRVSPNAGGFYVSTAQLAPQPPDFVHYTAQRHPIRRSIDVSAVRPATPLVGPQTADVYVSQLPLTFNKEDFTRFLTSLGVRVRDARLLELTPGFARAHEGRSEARRFKNRGYGFVTVLANEIGDVISAVDGQVHASAPSKRICAKAAKTHTVMNS